MDRQDIVPKLQNQHYGLKIETSGLDQINPCRYRSVAQKWNQLMGWMDANDTTLYVYPNV